jgi:hypothetical protein
MTSSPASAESAPSWWWLTPKHPRQHVEDVWYGVGGLTVKQEPIPRQVRAVTAGWADSNPVHDVGDGAVVANENEELDELTFVVLAGEHGPCLVTNAAVEMEFVDGAEHASLLR